MTKPEGNPNAGTHSAELIADRIAYASVASCFDNSSFLRHSSFVLRHSIRPFLLRHLHRGNFQRPGTF